MIEYFDQVPNEIIMDIFKYLSQEDLAQCSMVSKRFNALASDASLWKCWYLNKFTMTENIFRKLFFYQPKRLTISNVRVSVVLHLILIINFYAL